LEREADRLQKIAARDHVASRSGAVEQAKEPLRKSGFEHCNEPKAPQHDWEQSAALQRASLRPQKHQLESATSIYQVIGNLT